MLWFILLFDEHIDDKIAKAYGMLDLIKRSFTNMSRDFIM